MPFNVHNATSQTAIKQFFQSYKTAWSNDYNSGGGNGIYNIGELYKMYYYTSTFDSTVVRGRAYYKYVGEYENAPDIGYWCCEFNYNTSANLYEYILFSGTESTSTSCGLSTAELNTLTLYYEVNNETSSYIIYGKTVQTEELEDVDKQEKQEKDKGHSSAHKK
jgi:hypothetical protein